MTVPSLIDQLPEELVNRVSIDPILRDIASLDLKMIEQAIMHTSGTVPPKNLLALVNKVLGYQIHGGFLGQAPRSSATAPA